MSVLERLRVDRGDARVAILASLATVVIALTVISTSKTNAGEGPIKVCKGDIAVFERSHGQKLLVGAPVVRNAVGTAELGPVFDGYNYVGEAMYEGDDVGEGHWYNTLGESTTGPQTCEAFDQDHVPKYGETAILTKYLPEGADEQAAVNEMIATLASHTS